MKYIVISFLLVYEYHDTYTYEFSSKEAALKFVKELSYYGDLDFSYTIYTVLKEI